MTRNTPDFEERGRVTHHSPFLAPLPLLSPPVTHFYTQDLFDARTDRFEYLEDRRTCLIEEISELKEQLEGILLGDTEEEEESAGDDGEGAVGQEERFQLEEELAGLSSKLEGIRIQEWVRERCQ